jgi:hypothetical protein
VEGPDASFCNILGVQDGELYCGELHRQGHTKIFCSVGVGVMGWPGGLRTFRVGEEVAIYFELWKVHRQAHTKTFCSVRVGVMGRSGGLCCGFSSPLDVEICGMCWRVRGR